MPISTIMQRRVMREGKRRITMKTLFNSLLICLVAAISVTSCDSGNWNRAAEIAACTQRGIEYFREIGSYPTLSSAPNAGRSADDVAAERCNRTTTAF